MSIEVPLADSLLEMIAEREWTFRRQHVVRELGAYVPLTGALPRVDAKTQSEKQAFWSAILAALDGLDVEALSQNGRENMLVLREQVESLYMRQVHRDYERPFNGFTSFWDDTAAAIREETFDSEEKYHNAIGLMREIPRYFSENIDNMRTGLARGFSQPRIILPAIIGTLRAVVDTEAESTPYFQPFQSFPGQICKEQCDTLRSQARELIRHAVLPAFSRLLSFMETEYLPAAATDIAASSLPDGSRYYAQKVREYTTLEMTPDEIYDRGIDEVEICRANMVAVMEQSGFSGTLQDFLLFLANDPQFHATSAEDLLMRAAWICRKVEGKLHRFFALLPRQRFAIEPVPPAIAPTYPMGTGAPGLYLLNTHRLEARPLYLLPVLTLHEAVPGHCFQMALASENDDRPAFRSKTYAIAYGNAWALYCEKRLGVEMGVYETPYELFGMWSLLALRAVRMVVDVGVHLRGWSYERARDYMAVNTGLPTHVIETELQRYISWPAQALGYYLGMLTIERARENAERVLGDAFDIRAFHDRILALGPVPMTLVETTVNEMIAQSSPSATTGKSSQNP